MKYLYIKSKATTNFRHFTAFMCILALGRYQICIFDA